MLNEYLLREAAKSSSSFVPDSAGGEGKIRKFKIKLQKF